MTLPPRLGPSATSPVTLRDVTGDNWRLVAAIEVTETQRDFVAPTTYYLALCHYGGIWHPLAVHGGSEVVGFVMWAVDPGDRSGWIGGLSIDRAYQRRGFGRAAVTELLQRFEADPHCISAALSYSPENVGARDLYLSLGFEETGELEGDEIMARKKPPLVPVEVGRGRGTPGRRV